MFKRLRWMVLGAVLAFVAYRWLSEQARERVREMPRAGEEVARRARREAQGLAGRLAEAWREGREAMAAREDELRREILGG